MTLDFVGSFIKLEFKGICITHKKIMIKPLKISLNKSKQNFFYSL